jgi:hypothetical protein
MGFDEIGVRLNELHCLACGYLIDGALSGDRGEHDVRPTTGDYSVCINCNEVSIFVVADDGTVSLREANFIELRQFNTLHGAKARAVAEIRRLHNPNG